MEDTTKKIKRSLWEKSSTKEYPSEWDVLDGGGKISQRFWEYFKAIELLDLSPDSVILDIGGGSPLTGIGFFANVVSQFVKKVIILDPNIHDSIKAPQGIEFIREHASAKNFKNILMRNTDITHIVSLSVFEHIEPKIREDIIKDINQYFAGYVFVTTYEYHSKKSFFEWQLTTKTTSDLFESFSNFYLTDYCASPVACINSYDNKKSLVQSHWLYRRLPHNTQCFVDEVFDVEIPRWYPVVVKFEKNTPN